MQYAHAGVSFSHAPPPLEVTRIADTSLSLFSIGAEASSDCTSWSSGVACCTCTLGTGPLRWRPTLTFTAKSILRCGEPFLFSFLSFFFRHHVLCLLMLRILRRGRRQFLHPARWEEVRKTWLNHGIPTLVARKLEGTIDSGGWESL